MRHIVHRWGVVPKEPFMKSFSSLVALATALFFAFFLTACGGGGAESNPAAPAATTPTAKAYSVPCADGVARQSESSVSDWAVCPSAPTGSLNASAEADSVTLKGLPAKLTGVSLSINGLPAAPVLNPDGTLGGKSVKALLPGTVVSITGTIVAEGWKPTAFALTATVKSCFTACAMGSTDSLLFAIDDTKVFVIRNNGTDGVLRPSGSMIYVDFMVVDFATGTTVNGTGYNTKTSVVEVLQLPLKYFPAVNKTSQASFWYRSSTGVCKNVDIVDNLVYMEILACPAAS